MIISYYKHEKIRMEEVPEDPSAQNFRHHFTNYHWLRKFPRAFQQSSSRIMMRNLHWCYT